MPFVLRNLKLNESELLSVVDKGASGNDRHRPKIALVKRKKPKERRMPLSKWFRKSETETETETKKEGGGLKSPKEILESALADLPEEKQDAIMAAIAALSAQTGTAPAPSPEPSEEPKASDDEPEETPKAEGDAPKEEEERMAKVMKHADENTKAVLADIAKAMAEVKKESAELRKENAELRKSVGAQAAKARRADFEKKAQELPMVVADTAKVAELLDEADAKLGDESKKTLIEALKRANAIAKSSQLFDERGTAIVGEGTALGKLEGMAKSRVDEVRKSGGKLTYEQAFAEVMKENPRLYAEYRQESGL